MIKRASALIVGAALSLSGAAFAAVPADVTSAFTDLATDGATFMTSVWAAVGLFTVGFIWIKLFKKGLGKAT